MMADVDNTAPYAEQVPFSATCNSNPLPVSFKVLLYRGRARINGLKLKQNIFGLDMRKNFLRAVWHWSNLLCVVVGFCSLESFQAGAGQPRHGCWSNFMH